MPPAWLLLPRALRRSRTSWAVRACASSPRCPRCTATAGAWPGTTAASRACASRRAPRTHEPEYDELARQPLGDLGLLHLRWATPGLAVRTATRTRSGTARTCWPTTGPSTRRTGSARCCRRTGSGSSAGTTDSERYFLHLMWRLEPAGRRHGRGDRRHHRGHRGAVRAQQPERDPAAPDKLYAISWHDPTRSRGRQLRSAAAERPDEIAAYFDLAYPRPGGRWWWPARAGRRRAGPAAPPPRPRRRPGHSGGIGHPDPGPRLSGGRVARLAVAPDRPDAEGSADGSRHGREIRRQLG